MKALVVERNPARFGAARLASVMGSGRGAGIGPLRLADLDPPEPPGEGWHRVQPLLSGICGSDLATLDGHSSRYFEELVSFPFVPGHEVVGTLGEEGTTVGGATAAAGTRVVVEPVLGCAARGIEPPCPACRAGLVGNCERTAFGHLRPGIQTGYCADTGGGWTTGHLVAHSSQLHPVPEALGDRDAVMIEPLACGVHAALSPRVAEGDTVAVVGAGTVGLCVTAALGYLAEQGVPRPGTVLVGARYGHQRRLAEELGAVALPADRLDRAVRRTAGSLAVGDPGGGPLRLTGGADVVFDCVGTAASLTQALSVVRPRGQVVLVGMPGSVKVDLAPLWHREIRLLGAYTYGREERLTPPVRTFELAAELAGRLAARLGPGRLVSAAYPIDRFEEAVAHAGRAGRRGAVKVVFDLRETMRESVRRGARESVRRSTPESARRSTPERRRGSR